MNGEYLSPQTCLEKKPTIYQKEQHRHKLNGYNRNVDI